MIGLDLDGLLFYPEEIPVYVNPMLFPFNETDHAKSTITYRTYSPRSEDYIEIEVSSRNIEGLLIMIRIPIDKM